jgi:hypothetical protein
MRLINVRTLKLEEFFGDNIPQYAILSHTWDAVEISFEDMKAGLHLTQKRESFRKIRGCVEKALQEKLGYCWVDTCFNIQTHHRRQCPMKMVAYAAENGGRYHLAINTKLD